MEQFKIFQQKNKDNVKTFTRAKASCSSDSSSSMSSSPVTWNDNWISAEKQFGRISYAKRSWFCLRTIYWNVWNLDKSFWQLASEYQVFCKIMTLFTIIKSGNDLTLRSRSSRTGTLTLPRPQTAWKYLEIWIWKYSPRDHRLAWLGSWKYHVDLKRDDHEERTLTQRHLWSPLRSRLRWFSASGAVGGTARSSPCVFWETWLCSSQRMFASFTNCSSQLTVHNLEKGKYLVCYFVQLNQLSLLNRNEV